MPRYLFHLYDDEQTMDAVGRVFPNLDAAHADAIRDARAIMASDLTYNGEIHLGHRIELVDDVGAIAVVAFRDAVTIHP